jgi:hypothetical protein
MEKKVKAEELYWKYFQKCADSSYPDNMAKECALIAVDEVITALDFNQWQNAKIINYYKEVREEIENYE